MIKNIIQSFLIISFATTAYAQGGRNSYIKSAVPSYNEGRASAKKTLKTTTTRTVRTQRVSADPAANNFEYAQPSNISDDDQRSLNRMETRFREEGVEDQWFHYVMKGLQVGLEYGQLSGATKYKLTYKPTNASTEYTGTAEGAGALGVSMMYASLGRDSFGYSLGASVLHKVENDTNKTSGMSNAGAMTLIRPEANLLAGHNSGVWAGLGAHLSYVTADDEFSSAVAAVGGGLQAHIGFVPVRNFGFDVGYYVSYHSLKEDAYGSSLYKVESGSYFLFTQWGLRGTYMF